MKVALFWHNYPSENLGVGALSLSNIELIKASAANKKIHFICVGTMPGNLDKITEIAPCTYVQGSLKELIKNPIALFKLFNEIRKCKVAFDLGEGDSFSDIYGSKRFITQSIPKILALISRTPLILSPQTIGPFKSRIPKFIAGVIIKRSSAVFARDALSRQAAEDAYGSRCKHVYETSDLAFLLPYTQRLKQSRNRQIGINVSGLLFNGGYTGKNEFQLAESHSHLLELLISRLLKDKNNEITLVPHVISDRYEIEDDFRACKILAEKYELAVSPKFKSPIEAKSYISGFDFFIGSRMHATIAAVSSGVATVPLAYSRKFKGLYEKINYPFLLDLRESGAAEVVDSIEKLLSNDNIQQMTTAALSATQKAKSTLTTYEEAISSALDKRNEYT